MRAARFSCRTYDCRVYLFLGMSNRDPIMAEALRQWKPLECKTQEDRHHLLAARLALVDGGLPTNEIEAFKKLNRLPHYLEKAKQIIHGVVRR
jgi:hypothetical protein